MKLEMVGFRVTQKEKELLLKLVEKENKTITQFLKDSYIDKVNEYFALQANQKIRKSFMKKFNLDNFFITDPNWKEQYDAFKSEFFSDTLNNLKEDFFKDK